MSWDLETTLSRSADSSAFKALYERHHRHVYAYCRRRVSSDVVDDAVADVFLTVWRRMAEVPTEPDVRPWLYQVARLTLANYWRSATRRRNLGVKLETIGVSFGTSVSEQIVVREEVREALALLDGLRPSDREIIRLAVWEDLSHSEMAVVLGVTENNVRQRLFRAKKRLGREYEKRQQKTSATPVAQKGGER